MPCFHPSEYESRRKSRPTIWHTREDKRFEETFQDYGMWFNHVIKIEDTKMISADNLWKFLTRGAMILCANGQEGVDIVLRVCETKRKLCRHSVTAILIQVKNAVRFTKMKGTLFDAMSPLDLGIFPDSDVPLTTPKPIIRLVLALASPEAGVVFREGKSMLGQHQDHPFTAFDIWLAGLSTNTFRQIDGDLVPYQILLRRSLRPHDALMTQL
ncbi:hypothetical protein DFH94DRAFT_751903 [Russula ochroleuca]|jgi:hypothetical protein|uniref:Uncharacterized protein n=1 Tax=Russula ochroleuca TaxID=152965 RepID=A0A9P5T7X4_9AGAM|nr:hypothetical protein DFH94DRAFT_751903 [Russula ochroleuca]